MLIISNLLWYSATMERSSCITQELRLFRFWMKIGIPIMLPGIVGTFSVLFANAMGAYASAYALTGSSYNLVAIRIGALVIWRYFCAA